MIPLWLSPTQVRFIPIGDEFVKDCKKYVDELNDFSKYLYVRADIDDREESVSKKIREAEQEWIPIILVVGKKEKEKNEFNPRFRIKELGDENKTYSIKELHNLITEKTKSYPQEPIPMQLYLSKRPKFKG